MKAAYLDLVEDIKSNNQDLAKYIEDIKRTTEENLTNKFKNDQMKLLNVSGLVWWCVILNLPD